MAVASQASAPNCWFVPAAFLCSLLDNQVLAAGEIATTKQNAIPNHRETSELSMPTPALS